MTPAVLTTLTRTEARLFLREPTAVLFALVVPLVVLLVIGAIPAFREPSEALGGTSVVGLYVPTIVLFVLVSTAVGGLPVTLAAYRERGVLRRLATTPVGPTSVLAAQLALQAVLAVAAVVVVLTTGRVVFGVALPANPAAYVLVLVLAALAVLSLGLVVAALARTARAASLTGTLLSFPLLFTAGLWLPVQVMPEGLQRVADLSPTGAATQALTDAAAGAWPTSGQVAVLLAYAAVGTAVASRTFRWQ